MSDEKQGMIVEGATDEKDLDLDNSKVQFIKANGDTEAHIDMGESDSGSFCGLTKEELMKYADDPYWVRVRRILLASFWLIWLAMFAAAIIIIVLAPKCPHRPDQDWWQKCHVHEVYPRSFKDSDGDGVGDLNGIEDNLKYIQDNNADAVLLSSVYKSPNKDFGYDVVDHLDIDPAYGTMDDFNSLKSAIHKKGLKLIMDFIPNHSSKEHAWFVESSKAEANEYSNFYVWADAVPNNWVSSYTGESAWTKSDSNQKYYLHSIHPELPDLNLREPKVMEKLDEILAYWLDNGADGFRVNNAAYLYEKIGLEDEATAGDGSSTRFLNETYEAIQHWREMIDNHTSATNEGKYLMVDALEGSTSQVMKFYEYGADAPLNGNLLKLDSTCDSTCVRQQVNDFMDNLPADKTANWQIGNHDTSRIATRMSADLVNAANLLLLTLPGTSLGYYGDEIGMIDNADITSPQDTKDPSRDPERTPMQWNDGISAGFSNTSNTWLPVNANYHTINVKSELAWGNDNTNLKVFRDLVVLRDEPSMQWGEYTPTSDVNSKIFGYVRQAVGFEGYLVAVNFDENPGAANFHAAHPEIVPSMGKLVAHISPNLGRFDIGESIGESVKLDGGLLLNPGEAFVFKWSWDDSPTKE